MDGMSELRDCPFCGGEGGVAGRDGEWTAFCLRCACELVDFFDTRPEAIAAWNRRTPDGEVVAEGYAHKAEIRLAEDGPPWLPHGVTVNIWHDKANDYYAPVRLTCLVPLTRAEGGE